LQMSKLTIQKQKALINYFTETLSPGVEMEMALIMGGSFEMGSPKDEENHENNKKQHTVTIPTFFMGRTPVTQAQWRSVSKLPKIRTDLKPDPSNFKGNGNYPVEQVSWDESVEFCLRLSNKTGREYRLPSEAEWEYACRAGTTTPFHFGETIDAGLANYNGTATVYGKGVEGPYRKKTTPVREFPPNPWGLFDMHGNVWEWCQDDYESDYNATPTDGTAHMSNQSENTYKVRRGGSWIASPVNCRSAARNYNTRASRLNGLGFRVVCSASRTLV
jgi:formylglycine-generating enzyme required for sulfatase activity